MKSNINETYSEKHELDTFFKKHGIEENFLKFYSKSPELEILEPIECLRKFKFILVDKIIFAKG